MPTPRMRTISKAAEELQRIDPDCCLTASSIRRLAKSGQIRTVSIGRRILINLDELERYLSISAAEDQPDELPTGTIRAVPEAITLLDTRRRAID